LKQACKGLLYLSEIDAPWKVCSWQEPGTLSKKRLLELSGQPAHSNVQTLAFDEFFSELVTEKKWHGEEEKALVRKYQNLVKVLKDNLSSLQVYQVGASKLKIYVVGKTADGAWTGIETEALET
jgi:hypothetical protein